MSLNSPLNQGECHSKVSPVTSLGNIRSFVDMLFGSKTLKCSDPPECPETLRNFEDQLYEVKQLVLDLYVQFASFQESISTSLQEMKSKFQAIRIQQQSDHQGLSHSIRKLR